MKSLDKALLQAKFKAFEGNNSAFLGSLACQLSYVFTDNIETCNVDLATRTFNLNPDWFMGLEKAERSGVILNGLWHIALMHAIRQGARDTEKWVTACNIRVNNNLIKDGFTLPKPFASDSTYEDVSWTEEMIYEELGKQNKKDNNHNQNWGDQSFSSEGDKPNQDPGSDSKNELIKNNNISMVQSAAQTAKAADVNWGNGTGNIQSILDSFLRPKLPWRNILNNYLTDKLDNFYSWSRPNRRYRDMYLPSLKEDEGRLAHIIIFLDVSGSITDEQIKEFNSEVKYIKEELMPNKITVVQFDTEITHEQVFTEDMPFRKIQVVSGGGTSYRPVHDYIMREKPTLSIIFTDLYCNNMEKPDNNEVIWVVNSNQENTHGFGKTIYI